MVEGTSLLRKHMGLNLYRGFESLRLRQIERERWLLATTVFIFAPPTSTQTVSGGFIQKEKLCVIMKLY